jgi:hypothetical protein
MRRRHRRTRAFEKRFKLSDMMRTTEPNDDVGWA